MNGVKNMKKADIVGWTVTSLVIAIVVGTYLTAPGNTPNANAGHHRASSNINCDSKSYTRYLGMGNGPVLARMEVSARVCWRKFDVNYAGQIVRRKSELHISFYNTGWGDTGGWRFAHSGRYRLMSSNTFVEVQGAHSWTRQCLSVLGQSVCGATADFVPYVKFMSPMITEPHMDNGIRKNWHFGFHEGEPGQNAGSYDDNIYIRKSI